MSRTTANVRDDDAFSFRRMKMYTQQRKGTCGLCGAHDRDLYMIAAGDYIGWACGECRKQLRDSFIRQFCGTAGETEPAE